MSPAPNVVMALDADLAIKDVVETMLSQGLDHTVLTKPADPFAICITLIPKELEQQFTSMLSDFARRNKQ